VFLLARGCDIMFGKGIAKGFYVVEKHVDSRLSTCFAGFGQRAASLAAVDAVGCIIDLYNTERPHLSIGMLTPSEAHKGSGLLKKYWKKYSRKKKGEPDEKV